MGAKARLDREAKAAQATEDQMAAGLGVKKMDEAALVEATKTRINELRLLMNECDKRKIAVNFHIGKPVGGLAGSFEVTNLSFTRQL